MRVQIQSGATINISAYEYYFVLKEEDVDAFFQACMADNLGTFIEDPFTSYPSQGRLGIEEEEDIQDTI